MTGELRKRAESLQIEDVDWYIQAYMRCCARIEDEQRRSAGKNLGRLQHHLQILFEKIVADIGDEKTKRAQTRAAAAAINHAVSDHELPREMLRHYADDEEPESA